MNKDKLVRLAERCEAATGGDAEADYLIHALIMGWRTPDELHCFSWCVGEKYQFGHPEDERRAIYISESELPNYTASLDAAMTLVPEGCGLLLNSPGSYVGKPWAHINLPHNGPIPKPIKSEAATSALALCAAALRARSPEGDGK